MSQPPTVPGPYSPAYPGTPSKPGMSRDTKILIGVLGGVGGVVALCCIGAILIALLMPSGPSAERPIVVTAPYTVPSELPWLVSPSPSPSPTPLVLPSDPAASALPADKVYSGSGDKVVTLAPLDENYLYLATVTHRGSSNIAIVSRDADGQYLDLVVNEVGIYTGTSPLTMRKYPSKLEIDASGPWTVTVKVAQKATAWSGSGSGRGNTVLRVPAGTLTGPTSITATHTGSANFIVQAYGRTSSLLVNDIGRYSGKVVLPDDTVLIEIRASGSWTLKKS
ncbi:hypothetical protein F4553_004232 [Allocatelliglobosispora scoriae]|uniref:Uncharacterized protein n=1 Tax=Allocatelliglobosispora scoriae TaxID=643052 RepID=A0A841BVB3_9ACTN|nr:hypothetical protein [Allocatelliglobosispora scoriae]MBB5870853.1 hypothetical protein [Allocatelliglobosispora scoriae]